MTPEAAGSNPVSHPKKPQALRFFSASPGARGYRFLRPNCDVDAGRRLKIVHRGADDEDMFEFVRDAASVTTFPRAA